MAHKAVVTIETDEDFQRFLEWYGYTGSNDADEKEEFFQTTLANVVATSIKQLARDQAADAAREAVVDPDVKVEEVATR